MLNQLITALAGEFGAAVQAVAGCVVVLPPAGGARGNGWMTPITVSGAATGSVSMWATDGAASTLAKKILGGDDAPDAATIADLLRELWSQSAGSVSLMDNFTGITLVVGVPESAKASGASASFEVQLPDGPAGFIAGWGEVTVAPRAEAQPAAASQAAPPAAALVLNNAKLDLVLDIDLPIIVRFGRTVMTMKALSGLGPGSIVDMGRSPDDPCEMLVSDRVIARGEVVIVGGNYGIRITDLVSPAERVRALEA